MNSNEIRQIVTNAVDKAVAQAAADRKALDEMKANAADFHRRPVLRDDEADRTLARAMAPPDMGAAIRNGGNLQGAKDAFIANQAPSAGTAMRNARHPDLGPIPDGTLAVMSVGDAIRAKFNRREDDPPPTFLRVYRHVRIGEEGETA